MLKDNIGKLILENEKLQSNLIEINENQKTPMKSVSSTNNHHHQFTSLKDIILNPMDAEALTKDSYPHENFHQNQVERLDAVDYEKDYALHSTESDSKKKKFELENQEKLAELSEKLVDCQQKVEILEKSLASKTSSAQKYKHMYFMASIKLIGSLSELERINGIKFKMDY